MKTAVLLLAAGAAVIGQGAGATKTVNDGVFTVEQAERGRTVFESKCTTCHDTGRFTGPDFVKPWSAQPLQALFDVVKTTMPEDNPGSLQPQQYADVITYFLVLNKYPAGQEELNGTAEAMKAVVMEALTPPGM